MNKYRIKLRQYRYNWVIIYAVMYLSVFLAVWLVVPQVTYGIIGLVTSLIALVVCYIASSEIVRRL
jgi:hypothetical protein